MLAPRSIDDTLSVYSSFLTDHLVGAYASTRALLSSSVNLSSLESLNHLENGVRAQLLLAGIPPDLASNWKLNATADLFGHSPSPSLAFLEPDSSSSLISVTLNCAPPPGMSLANNGAFTPIYFSSILESIIEVGFQWPSSLPLCIE